jgi:methylated-DNA-[protein]-cysteine S-methyltransferase
MKNTHVVPHCFFESPIGLFGIAWNTIGILRLQLPERTKAETLNRLLGQITQAHEIRPDMPWIAEAVYRIQDHLQGNLQDFRNIPLDLTNAPPFHRRVYLASLTIPPGSVKTYGDIAKQIGVPLATRAVGQALGRNPIALIIPCHRIVAANGKSGGFSAFGGLHTKEKMLAIEGAVPH